MRALALLPRGTAEFELIGPVKLNGFRKPIALWQATPGLALCPGGDVISFDVLPAAP